MTRQIYKGLCRRSNSQFYGFLHDHVFQQQYIHKSSIRHFFRQPFAMSSDSANSESEKATAKRGQGSPSIKPKDNHAEGEGNHGRKKITRQELVAQERDRFLQMTREEKRKNYTCRGKYETLEKVIPWEQYCEKVKESDQETDTEVRPDLNAKVSLWKGDITKIEIDAIVNAANSSLLGGGGVDGAIHSAAGSSLLAECKTLNGCEVGDAKITAGYKLPAKYIMHTVGPMGAGDKSLQSCYDTCLNLMQENELHTIAFPCIATGIYGFPNDRAANIAIRTVRNWLEKNEEYTKSVERVIFCIFLDKDRKWYEEFMQVYFPTKKRKGKEEKFKDQPQSKKKKSEKSDTYQTKKEKPGIFSKLFGKSGDNHGGGNKTSKGKEKSTLKSGDKATLENTKSKKGSQKDIKQTLATTKSDEKNKTENKTVNDNAGSDNKPDKTSLTETSTSKDANSGDSKSNGSMEKVEQLEMKEKTTSANTNGATEGVENMGVNDKDKEKSPSDPLNKDPPKDENISPTSEKENSQQTEKSPSDPLKKDSPKDEDISPNDLKSSVENQIESTEKQLKSSNNEKENGQQAEKMEVGNDEAMPSVTKDKNPMERNTEDADTRRCEEDKREAATSNTDEKSLEETTQSYKKTENARL